VDGDVDGDVDVEGLFASAIGYFDSIFSGLISLRELSLRENQLMSASLRGLLYFALGPVDSKLTKLWIDDNPLCGSQKALRACSEALIKSIPSLSSINDKDYLHSTNVVDVVAILRNGQQRISNVDTGNDKGFANMEKEYLSALRGERENTVVS
jgi:hypothetical protein